MMQAGNLLAVTRMLEPTDFGAFAGIAALAITLGALSSFGSHLVLLREMSQSPERSSSVLPYALGATAICGGILLLAFAGISTAFLPHSQVRPAILIPIGIAEILIQPFLVFASIDRQARGKIADSQLMLILPLALRLLAALLIMVYAPPNPLEVYGIAYLCAAALSLLLAQNGLASRWPAPWKWRVPRKDEWGDAGGFAALNLTALGPTELDKTLASRLMPLASAGLYAASARVVGALVLPVMALMLATLPRLFRDGHQTRGHRLIKHIFGSAMAYGVLAGTALYLTASSIEQLFGPAYAGMGTLLGWLALAVPGMALRVAAGNSLMAISHPWWRAGTELVGLATLFIAASIFSQFAPQSGMPLALACSEWIMAMLGWLLLLRRRIV